MSKMISIVVPVYNNEETLDETCRQLLEVHETSFSELRIELIFVNDGSKDASWAKLKGLKALHGDKVVLLDLARNFGQQGALLAGFNRASGDAVVCVSADLQDPIVLIAKMVAYWKNDTEIVVCYREGRRDGLLARFFSHLAYMVARTSTPELPRGGFDYWLMSRRVRDLLCSFKGRHNFLQGNLLYIGLSKAFIPYTREQRKFGKSGYTLAVKLWILVNFLVDSSYVPIRTMSCMGALVFCGGIIYSLLVTYSWFIRETPFSGWAPIMISIMMVGGFIMLMLGVIGEYIWRIYDNMKDLPLFIVKEEAAPKIEEKPK